MVAVVVNKHRRKKFANLVEKSYKRKAYTLKNFPAALAIYLRNPITGKAYTFKKISAARAIYLRTPIREKAYTLKKFPAARLKYITTV